MRLQARPFALAMASSSNASPSAGGNLSYDDHTHPHQNVTCAQWTFFLTCLFAGVMWLLEAHKAVRKNQSNSTPTPQDAEHGKVVTLSAVGGDADTTESLSKVNKGNVTDRWQNGVDGSGGGVGGGEMQKNDVIKKSDVIKKPGARPGEPPVPTVEEALMQVTVFGAVMMYVFLCDYIKIFPEYPRLYDQDQFLFLLFLLFLVGCAFTLQPNDDKILNRDMTEEWKGWMQVMFVWYHYFAAKDWYNWIRVYIACYVWMTGFGNFSFFWIRGDYSLWRVLKMLFRMNFLVVAVVVVTDNEYMLYYICAMHTYWFLTVYAFMRVLTSWNTHRWRMNLKFAAYIVCNAIVFEIPGNCSAVFRPLWFIFGFRDGKHDIMHEWEFRAGLDHWACLLGMVCAYNYPHFEAFIKYLESSDDGGVSQGVRLARKLVIKVGMVTGAAVVGIGWYFAFMREDKFTYNATHCYTSLIPIPVFIVLRNSFPVLRRWHCGLFAFLGKITLETYLSQLHIYLQSNAKHLIGYLPQAYPLLNFALATVVYLLISHRLFSLTLSFSAFFIQKDWQKGARMVMVGLGLAALAFVISLGLKALGW